MANSIIKMDHEYGVSDIILTIPINSTLPITFNTPGITNDMQIINASISNTYVFQTLDTTIGNGSITINGTRWGTYDNEVIIELFVVKTISITGSTS